MKTLDFRQFSPNYQDGFPLEVRRVQRHRDTDLHAHNFSELVIILHGSGTHLSPGGAYPIGAGDVFVLHGTQSHGYCDAVDLDLVNILFHFDQLAIPLQDITALPGYHALFTLEPIFRQRDKFESRLRLAPDALAHMNELISRLNSESQHRVQGWRFAMVANFMLLVADLCRYYSHMEDAATQSLLRLGRVLGYLEQHYTERLTLDDLATVGCMSRRTLTRDFRTAMGCSLIDYLLRLRLHHAARQLHNSDAGITEIAFRVGFQDSNYFSRQFRAIFGCSPREYRQDAGQTTLQLR